MPLAKVPNRRAAPVTCKQPENPRKENPQRKRKTEETNRGEGTEANKPRSEPPRETRERKETNKGTKGDTFSTRHVKSTSRKEEKATPRKQTKFPSFRRTHVTRQPFLFPVIMLKHVLGGKEKTELRSIFYLFIKR